MRYKALQSLLLPESYLVLISESVLNINLLEILLSTKAHISPASSRPGAALGPFLPTSGAAGSIISAQDLFRLMETALPVKPSPLPPWFFLSLCTSKSFPKGSWENVSNTYECPYLWVQVEHFVFVCPPTPLNFILIQPQAQPQPQSRDSSHGRALSRKSAANREQGSDIFYSCSSSCSLSSGLFSKFNYTLVFLFSFF